MLHSKIHAQQVFSLTLKSISYLTYELLGPSDAAHQHRIFQGFKQLACGALHWRVQAWRAKHMDEHMSPIRSLQGIEVIRAFPIPCALRQQSSHIDTVLIRQGPTPTRKMRSTKQHRTATTRDCSMCSLNKGHFLRCTRTNRYNLHKKHGCNFLSLR